MRVGPGSGRLRAATRDRVIYAEATGVITIDAIQAIRRKLASAAIEVPAVVLDFSKSALAITSAGLARLDLEASPGVNRLAMAWVVPDEQTAEIWRVQAFRFALLGLRRYVTCSAEDAQEWAQLQARVSAMLR
jgi:hypothetical protein